MTLDPVAARSTVCLTSLSDSQKAMYASKCGQIGETGFEPATARPPAECATRLRHSPVRDGWYLAPGCRGLKHGVCQTFGAEMGDLLVAGIHHHLEKFLTTGIADKQDRVPFVAGICDHRG